MTVKSINIKLFHSPCGVETTVILNEVVLFTAQLDGQQCACSTCYVSEATINFPASYKAGLENTFSFKVDSIGSGGQDRIQRVEIVVTYN